MVFIIPLLVAVFLALNMGTSCTLVMMLTIMLVAPLIAMAILYLLTIAAINLGFLANDVETLISL